MRIIISCEQSINSQCLYGILFKFIVRKEAFTLSPPELRTVYHRLTYGFRLRGDFFFNKESLCFSQGFFDCAGAEHYEGREGFFSLPVSPLRQCFRIPECSGMVTQVEGSNKVFFQEALLHPHVRWGGGNSPGACLPECDPVFPDRADFTERIQGIDKEAWRLLP
jgi:hypothetical protein